jgi:peptidoglycan-associated lipoprotein
MKNIVLSGVVAALLMLSGCSDKELVVDNQNNPMSDSSQSVHNMGTETVSGEDSLVDSSSSLSDSVMSIDELNSRTPSIYFGFDKFDISQDMSENISTGVTIVKNSGANINVKLEGNCDEWGSDEYNFALGLKRASSVKKALIAEGIDESRISMVSFGESNPTCKDSTQECWSKNRRVDFKFLP